MKLSSHFPCSLRLGPCISDFFSSVRHRRFPLSVKATFVPNLLLYRTQFAPLIFFSSHPPRKIRCNLTSSGYSFSLSFPSPHLPTLSSFCRLSICTVFVSVQPSNGISYKPWCPFSTQLASRTFNQSPLLTGDGRVSYTDRNENTVL